MSKELTQQTIGKLIPPNSERDAIHIAVLAVMATEELTPGQHIGFSYPDNFTAVGAKSHNGKLLGIVDPYLRKPVMGDDWFWMFIYPNKAQALRHAWTHRDIPAEESGLLAGTGRVMTQADLEKITSKFADEDYDPCCPSEVVEDVHGRLLRWMETGDPRSKYEIEDAE